MITNSAKKYGLEVGESYEVVDAFTTLNGSWEPSDAFWGIAKPMRDKYLKPAGAEDYFDDAGADHHVFVRYVDSNENPAQRTYAMLLPDGRSSHFETKPKSGWANLPLWNMTMGDGTPSQIEWYEKGSPNMLFRGGGLPFNYHVSLFLVLRDKSAQGPVHPDLGITARVEGNTVIIETRGAAINIEVV